MERNGSISIEDFQIFKERLLSAASEETDGNERRRIEEFGYWPSKPIKIANLPAIETFVRLVETTAKFQRGRGDMTARNTLTYAVELARQLTGQLPGHDEAVKFVFEETSSIGQVNEPLAEDISKILTKVMDEERFR